MKFRTKLFLGVLALVLVGAVAAFLFLPKSSKGSGVSFITDSGVDATVSGGVTGNASVLELSELTYSGGETPTGGDLSSWEANLEFGEGYEVILTISVSNNAGSILYVALVDNGTNVNNLTKTIKNGTETYTSGTLVMVQGRSNTTFTITFRREHDVATKITYRYEIKLQSTLTEEDLQNVETPDETGFTYKYDEVKGEAGVTGLTTTNTQTALTIPSMVVTEGKMYIVTVIEANAFKGKNITSVVVPNTVKELKASVFENCSKLTQVTIPNSVTKLGNKVFKGCTTLTSIQLPNTITSVGTYLFSGCTKLENYNIPTGIKKLSNYMFENCTKLTTFNIPSHITTLGDYVFNGLSFETLSIPDSITSVTENTFSGITNITELTIPCSVTKRADINNLWGVFRGVENIQKANIVVTNKGSEIGRAFHNCSGLTSVTITEGVTSIGEYAFEGCSGLTSVTIPSSVISIGKQAFLNCSGLTKVVTPSIEAWLAISFGNSSNPLINTHRLYIGEEEVTELTIPNTITEIKAYAFYDCSSLTSVTIPEGVTSIGNYAFAYCSGLTSVTIPSSVTSIGDEAFRGCSGLTSVTIPEGVTSIGEYAFYDCSGLTSVTIPSSVISIGKQAFWGCSGLTKVVTPSIEAWLAISFGDWTANPLCNAQHLFIGEEEVTELTIPNTITEIKAYAFYKFSNLTSLTFAENSRLTSIGTDAFRLCTSLTSITIPSTVTRIIGNTTFESCYALAEIYNHSTYLNLAIGSPNNGYIAYYAKIIHTSLNEESLLVTLDGVTYYKESADSYIALKLADKTKTQVVLNEKTTSINQHAFYDCSSLTGVTIPEGVTSIGNYAFWDCGGLTSITIPSSVTSIGEYAFEYCYALAELYNLSTSIKLTKGSSNNGHVAHYAKVIHTSLNEESLLITLDGVTYYKESADSYIAITLLDKTKTQVVLNEKTRSINQRAFRHCTSLTSITIPEGVTSIGEYAFYGCSGLTSVTIPEGVTSIGNYAFYDCSSLTSVTIPSSVTSIGNVAFDGCSGLTKVVTPSIEDWLAISFGNWAANPLNYAHHLYIGEEEVTELTIPNTITSIKACAFYGCSGLTSVTIPSSVTSIGSNAFCNCSGLTSVTITEGVTSIGYEAFYNCSSLTSITIPSSVTSIGNSAFTICTNLKTVTIDSANIYKKAVGISYNQAGNLLLNATTINVLASVVDDVSNTNTFLNDATMYTKSATTTTIDGKAYYVYTKIV